VGTALIQLPLRPILSCALLPTFLCVLPPPDFVCNVFHALPTCAPCAHTAPNPALGIATLFCTYVCIASQISDATSSVGTALIELRRIEAMRETANTLSRSRNVVYLPSGNNMLLGLNPGMGGRD